MPMTSKEKPPASTMSYKQSGVDIDAGNALVAAIKPALRATRRPGANGEIGGFGGLFDLKAAGFSDPVLVAANDGVGTKLRIAIEMEKHATIGIDLVAMCVNDLIVQGAEPLFFLDYLATGALDVNEASQIIQGIAAGCREAGCALIGGETAEMPGMYHNKDYDLAGFSVGAVERNALLPKDNIEAGDVLVSIASSGIHSNGFSLVRKLVEASGANWRDTAPFEPATSLGEALLTPTRIYVKAVLAALKAGIAIKGLVHITGGGFIDNIPRILPAELAARIDLDALMPPPVFAWLAQTGALDQTEMLRTFNCGTGMIAIVPEDAAKQLISHLTQQGEKASIIGTLTKRSAAAVEFSGKLAL